MPFTKLWLHLFLPIAPISVLVIIPVLANRLHIYYEKILLSLHEGPTIKGYLTI